MAKTKVRISREELEREERVAFGDAALAWIYENYRVILACVATFFLVYAIVLYVKNLQEANLGDANNQLYEATLTFERSISQNDYASEGRSEALSEVIGMVDPLIEDPVSDEIAQNALFLKANAYYFAGDELGSTSNTDQAIQLFEDYQVQVENGGSPFERAGALLALAYANENRFLLSNEPDYLSTAINYYDQLIAMEPEEVGFLRADAMVAKGRNLQFQGRTDDAKALYMEVLKERFKPVPDPELADNQREMIMASVRNMASQFTAAATARQQLIRMGVPQEEIEAVTQQAEETG